MKRPKTEFVVHVLARTTVQQVEIPPTVPDATAKDGRRETKRSRRGSVHISPNSILRLTEDEWNVLRSKPELKASLRLVAREDPPRPRPVPSPPPQIEVEAAPTEGDEATPEVVEESPAEESPAAEESPSEEPSSPNASRKRRGRRS